MSFSSPVLLLLLIIVPLAGAAYLWLEDWRESRAARWASAALLPNMMREPSALRRYVPISLLLIGLALLLVGFARPKVHRTESLQEATVIVVLDDSGSMAAKDSSPTRLGAAKTIADRYVSDLPKGYRMAVMTFSDHSAVVAPPTQDLTRVRQAIAAVHTAPQGTALADAVLHAVTVAKSVRGSGNNKRPPAVIVVMSDGGQTAGRASATQAAQAALAAHIPVTTIALGTPNGIVTQPVKGGFKEQIEVPAQPGSLKTMAQMSGGRFDQGVAAVNVKATYAELGSRVGHARKTVEITSAAAGGGLFFMLAGALLSGVWFRRLV